MEPIRILPARNGGRGHALACTLSQSPVVSITRIEVPGNGGDFDRPQSFE
jgi:hypothetical protein